MSIPRFFSRQTVLVNMVMVAILVAGVFALKHMPLESYPSIDLDVAFILIPYPGAAPDEVEKLITLPIEDQIKSLPDVDFINARSEEGRATFFIKYLPDLEDFDQAITDLKSEIDKVEAELPQEAQDGLMVIKISTDEVWPIIGISLGGDYTINGLNELAEAMKEEFLNVPDVSSVDIYGILNREIWVEADRVRMDAAGLSILELNNIVKASNINLPSGRVEMGREEFLVRSMGEINDPKEIGKIVVRGSMDGKAIRISDIAEVKDTFQKDEVPSRLNGKPSVYVRAFMKRNGSIVRCVDDIRAIVKRFQKDMPDVEITVNHDMSEDVRDSLDVLSTNALSGLVLVALLMTVAIGARSAMLAIIGIPFAFLSAFIFLAFTGGSINTLSLFAFILVLGMIVDDAIIIIENVYRHMEEGTPPLQAAIKGTEQVMWPVIAAILTTVAAFMPLLMMEGTMGKFLAVLPIVVTLALVGSLVQSLVVLPSHLADFGRLPKNKESRFGERAFQSIQNLYTRQLNFFLNHRYKVSIGIVILTIASIAVAVNVLRVEMFPVEQSNSESMIVKLPIGTKLEETDRIVAEIERRIREIPKKDIDEISSLSGLYVEDERWTRTTDAGMITVEFSEDDDRRTNDEIKEDIRERIADIPEIRTAYFTERSDGPPTGKPVELRIRGNDLDRMNYLAEMVMDDLRNLKGVSDVDTSYTPGKKELRFIPDRVKMSAYGLDMTTLSTTMRTAIEGFEATKFRDEDGKEVKVLVMYREEDRNEVEDLKNLIVSTPLGIQVPLSELGEFSIQRGAATIRRRDGKRSIKVTANVNNTDINSDEANRFIKEKYADFSTRYPGYSLEFGGRAERQAESFNSLIRAFIVALIVIYLILGTQFQSFTQPMVVMFTVPFSIFGVCVGLIVQDLTFSLLAGISVVALSGVVVNDSLVLVDFVNKARATGIGRREALLISGTRRMRPILLTTVTTVAGLLPMAMGIGGKSLTWQPLAICFCWGLTFATFLTLFVIPSAYSILDDWVNFFRRKFGLKSTDEALLERAAELQDETITADLKEV